ncbi:uncharacterized protein [Littorina saxatilis]|uniref:uncharacterized protein isoform X2 n=1 Tax=Littorina saxatilis TaxID=31220 RepID=UPI0038B60913
MMPDLTYISAVVLLLGTLTSLWASAVTKITYEMYDMKPNTNRSVACGVCEARGGHLAWRPELNDWEILFGNYSHLETRNFWVDLIKADNGEWYWGDGMQLNMSHISSLPMNSTYNQTYAATHCALWNMAEPFLIPATCDQFHDILCQMTETTECTNRELGGMKFNESTTGMNVSTATNFTTCKSECNRALNCWAADWNKATNTCRKLEGTGTSRPAVPDLVSDPGYTTIARTCVTYQEMTAEESDFVCNCGAIELPETEDEKDKFVEDHKKEVEKELIVPKETLSATVRKKESAPDERKSSTSIGYLGITMMAAVFGGLVLMDLTSLLAHIKMALTNVKGVFINEEETSDA